MGDRALIQFHAGKEPSPVLYLHWCGESEGVRALLTDTRALMAGRVDVPYALARCIGLAHERTPGNLSLGVWNQETALSPADSHGDFGIARIDLRDWSVECFGGYGLDNYRGDDSDTPRHLSIEF